MADRLPDSLITPAEAFRLAVTELGGQSATARVLGVSQQAISAKLAAGKPCSPKWVRPLAEHTSVSKHDLGPDLYPRELIVSGTAHAPAGMEPAP